MVRPLVLHADRLFPAEPETRVIARRLHNSIKELPIVSPHGHTDPAWFASDAPFADATDLLLPPDFNDDTRAFMSIPARHDVSRRIDCGFLAGLVADHRLEEWEAAEIAADLAYAAPKRAYKL
jgi:glucuronate isomerase